MAVLCWPEAIALRVPEQALPAPQVSALMVPHLPQGMVESGGVAAGGTGHWLVS